MGRESTERFAETEAERREAFERMGDLVPNGHYDTGCKKCAQKQLRKEYCWGRTPGRRVDKCMVVGDHLHGTCAVCGFTWLERCKDDELMIEGRGGLRHDEVRLDDGRIVHTPKVPQLVEMKH